MVKSWRLKCALQFSPRAGALIEKNKMLDSLLCARFLTSDVDTSDLMSAADLVITFPFSSTSAEALSADKPALWHDSQGLYRDTPYGHLTNVTTHSDEELRAQVQYCLTCRSEPFKNPVPLNSPLLDPYRDGKAIDRFRGLLINA